jgi:hypothetical protein
MANPLGAIADLFSGLIGGGTADVTTGTTEVTGWLSGAAGQVASAIESGFIATIKDVWDVVLGPVEVLVGAVLMLLGVAFMIKSDLPAISNFMGMI